jgi:ABC-type multidrug transport system ATPase subunit
MLKLVGLGKGFGTKRVLRGMDADLDPGTVTAVIGANGSGKSTLLRILWGELRPDAGSLLWEGEAVDTGSERWKRLVGAVPDDDALIDGLSIRGHFRLCGGLSCLAPGVVEDRASGLIEIFGLSEAEKSTRSVGEASRGNRKRLACALALLGEPRVVLMDEPFSGLDMEMAALLSGILSLLASRGLIVAFSSHDDGITRSLADRYLFLADGSATSGPARDLPERPSMTSIPEGALPWL